MPKTQFSDACRAESQSTAALSGAASMKHLPINATAQGTQKIATVERCPGAGHSTDGRGNRVRWACLLGICPCEPLSARLGEVRCAIKSDEPHWRLRLCASLPAGQGYVPTTQLGARAGPSVHGCVRHVCLCHIATWNLGACCRVRKSIKQVTVTSQCAPTP